MIELRDYQKKAVESLKKKVQNVLNTPDNKVVIFQAPTGSGKTVMVSAMKKMIIDVGADSKKFMKIKSEQIIGVELVNRAIWR